MNRLKSAALSALLTLSLAGVATAAVINVPGDQPTIQAGINAASPFDIVLVAPGTYVITTTIAANVANLTIRGSGVGTTTLQVAQSVGNIMAITGAGTTLEDFTIQKTDVTGVHELVWVNAASVTIQNNEIFGPDPGSLWSVNGIVSRAIIVSGGANGLLITGNTIHHLRQPAYVSGPTVGTISNNVVYGTRGWVNEGGNLAFTGNSWSTGGNQGADIALLAFAVNPAWYPNLIALSNANSDAYISAQFVGGANGRATAYVDDSQSPTGFGMSTNPYTTITEGVGGALPGGTVSAAAGTYVEQVSISGKNLTLQGAGSGLTLVHAPAILASTFATPSPNRPVITAMNSGNIRIRDLTVNGLGVGNANVRIEGIAYWNAGGGIHDCRVTAIRNTPADGSQYGVAVYSNNNTGGPYTLEVDNVLSDDFQKNAMALSGTGMVVNVHDCTATGNGNIAYTAQNGIQVGFGASGTIAGCKISDIRYTPATFVASGVLVYQPGGSVAVSGLNGANSIDDVQAPISWYDGSGSMDGIEVSGAMTAGVDFGPIFIGNFTTLLAGNERPNPSPVLEDYEGSSEIQAPVAYSVSVTNSCLSGSDVSGTVGIYAYSAAAPLTVTATNNVIEDWDVGLYADGATVLITANDNSIASNVTAGYDNTASGAAQNAESNWWGDASGPAGAGDDVIGGNVDFTPWRVSGASLTACAFTPAATNAVTPGPALSCLSIDSTCIMIPVDIARTSSDNVRGFSINILLSPELVLCGAGITEGTYLSNVGGTNFQIVSNGGGSYTIDCAILGLPCGATAVTGNLFNVRVARSGTDGTGTIMVTSVTLRDCDNGPVPGTPGPSLSISIDTVVPAAVTNLAATQVKVGNDSDGTTKITLTFTVPGDADTAFVYRAGFGDYPEYDDGFGAVPATPSYPPGPPWTITNVTASGGQVDTTAARDFWYFVVFTKDLCGNVSAVSNKTTGTLNYHLGDTHNGTTDCVGNNLVNTSDISHLGGNYGVIGLVYGDPRNCLDVGPTTNASVNARPTTDNRIQFEDLILFAINYGQVSKPDVRHEDAAERNEIEMRVPENPSGQFDVTFDMSGAGNIQGLSLDMTYDPEVVEPMEVSAGELLGRQGFASTVLSSGPGNVDVALLGSGAAISGRGELARVTFRVRAAGDPALGLKGITARDGQNRSVEMGTKLPDSVGPIPDRDALGAAYPNPFRQATVIPFRIRANGHVSLAIFDVMGRRVSNLVDDEMTPGEHAVNWDGRTVTGSQAVSGFYVVRLETPSGVQTQQIKLVR